LDLKALGYLVSTVSVLLLGMAAWPKPDEPAWKALAVSVGMATSIGGMGFRWLSHRKEKAAIAYAQRAAEQSKAQKAR